MYINLCTFLICVLSLLSSSSCARHCPRDRSRTVRRLLKEVIYPLFQQAKTSIPDTCQFSPERDKYVLQEENKVSEGISKWYCDYCGKGFYAEDYLDRHFDNKHPEFVREDKSAVCFADYCDIMRCDILDGRRRKEFWDVSLCLESDMKELMEDCEKLMSACVPDGLSKNATEFLITHMTQNVCSFLTCKKYWDSAVEEENEGIIFYSILTVFLIIMLTIYYCVAYHYFYTDTFTDSYYDTYYERNHPLTNVQTAREDNSGTRRRILEEDFDAHNIS
ncbi:uncharacterized protein LOC133183610 [Saccostrea echinata]|uniref:uncharacterized protein LOC133183610 n=1 Tax=Saccostrea echinata TaxID=191078 RepID=UPI002A7F2ADF|nr:uncharacterized protein LOC133183610 [Saccostrea echinata]